MGRFTRDIQAHIGSARLMPVVVLHDALDAVPLARALLKGGLDVIEVTFRTTAAAESIRQITLQVPEMLVGAGTVLTEKQVNEAVDAGAKFVLTPGFNPIVVEACQRAKILIVPGVNNPTGVEQAMNYGLDLVKFFPAEATGGVAFLKAMSGPYGGMNYIPTGGINLQNLPSYLALKTVRACGGSWMVDPELIKAKKFDTITELTAQAVAQAKSN